MFSVHSNKVRAKSSWYGYGHKTPEFARPSLTLCKMCSSTTIFLHDNTQLCHAPFPWKRGRGGKGVAFMMSRQRGKLIRNAWNSTQSHPNLRAATVRNCRKSREMLLNFLIRTSFLRISWFIRCKNFILITQGWHRKLNQTERKTKKKVCSIKTSNLVITQNPDKPEKKA